MEFGLLGAGGAAVGAGGAAAGAGGAAAGAAETGAGFAAGLAGAGGERALALASPGAACARGESNEQISTAGRTNVRCSTEAA